jgi:Big-like domain-containing protein
VGWIQKEPVRHIRHQRSIAYFQKRSFIIEVENMKQNLARRNLVSRTIVSVALLCVGSALDAATVDPSVNVAAANASPGARGQALRSASEKNDVSPPLASMPRIVTPSSGVQVLVRPSRVMQGASILPQFDPVVQTNAAVAAPLGAPMPSTLTNWAGIGQTNFAPPDTNLDVGPNHVVQIVNSAFQVWDKTGTSLFGPASIKSVWQGFGGLCELRDLIDPTVLYDSMADRWLIAASTGPFQPDTFQCIAVSSTPDPLGAWNRYAFLMPSGHYQDYAKFGVWPDGYYMSAIEWSNDLKAIFGSRPFVFDRTSMQAGQPATFQTTSAPLGTAGPGALHMLPSDLDGTMPPPAGAPNYFVELGLPMFNIWQFHVDWAIPANTTFSLSGTIAVAGFAVTGALVAQKGTSAELDVLETFLMNRLAYRNFGDHESLVVNHTVTVGTGGHGVRWYEFRDPGTTSPTVYQQGTFAPDGNSRWMGSAAMDRNGNIALGYSVSSSDMYPSIRYAGRLASDPLGILAQGEASAFEGVDFQLGNRWGDYSGMTVDPVDDCTFWYTTEYSDSRFSSYDWRTRIVSFRFPECGPSGTSPRIAISTPSNGAQVAEAVQILISGTASDDASVSKVEIAIDNGPYALASGTTSWEFPTAFTPFSGRHVINARATNNLGLTGTTAITVDGTFDFSAPTISITAPRDKQAHPRPFLVEGTASDPDGVFLVEIMFDANGVWIPCSGTVAWSCGPFLPGQFSKGKHTLTVRVTDNLDAFAQASLDFRI